MKTVLGLDVGSSTTKIVAMDENKKILRTEQVSADDQLTSLFGSVGKMLHDSEIGIESVSKIALTGVGGSYHKGDIFGIPTIRVSEMDAMGRGGLYLSGYDWAIIVSIGTGTTFVTAGPEGVEHIGGLALGGGSLTGLSSRLFGTRDYATILDMAGRGDLKKVDRLMSEISLDKVSNLPDYATASNLGKMSSSASDEDVALGLFNMIYQTVGTMAVFACRRYDVKDVVMTGSMSSNSLARLFLDQVGDLYGVNFHIHEKVSFATAAGAALHAL